MNENPVFELDQSESEPVCDSFKAIWETLKGVDVSKQIKQKNNLNYLSWSWAWGTLMEYYPEATYKFKKPYYYDNGTCDVRVEVEILGNKRKMWLPVMNFKNQAIPHPTSKEISDAKMRCLVKCIAMFGLGHYIYAGEDIPSYKATPKDKTVLGKEVDVEKVEKAYEYLVKLIGGEEESDDMRTAAIVQETYHRLSADEQIAVNDLLKDVKAGRKQYNTIMKEYLQYDLRSQMEGQNEEC